MAGTKIKEAILRLKREEAVAFGTDTVNGIGCLYSSKKGIAKIYEMKKRDERKPLILLCSSFDMASEYFFLDSLSEGLMHRHMPGALTLVVKPKKKLNEFLILDGHASFRIPSRRSVLQIIEGLGMPLASTSLNEADKPVLTDRNEIKRRFKGIFIANNLSSKTIPSTVAKCDRGKIVILRAGAVKLDEF